MTDGKDIAPEIKTAVGGLARASAKGALKKVPVLGTFIEVLSDAEANTKKRRRELWAEWLLGTDDEPEAYAGKVADALAGGQGPLVREAVNESIRAALDAVDEIVVPSLALLTRRYLNTKTPDRRTYRELISVLRALDEAEFFALRQAVHKLGWVEGDPLRTVLITDPGPDVIAAAVKDWHASPDADSVWNWFTPNPPKTILVLGEMAPRLVAALEPLQGSTFYSEPQQGRHKPRFPRTLIQVMVEVMPEAQTDSTGAK